VGIIRRAAAPQKSKDSSSPVPSASRNGERHTGNSCVDLPEEDDVDTSSDLGGLVGITVQVPNDQPPFVTSSYCLDSDEEEAEAEESGEITTVVLSSPEEEGGVGDGPMMVVKEMEVTKYLTATIPWQ